MPLDTNDLGYLSYLEIFNSVKQPVSEPKTSAGLKLKGKGILTVQVDGCEAISMKVQGCVRVLGEDNSDLADADCEWYDLAVTNLLDKSEKQMIDDKGLFSCNVLGLVKIRFVIESITGTAKIVGTLR